MITEQTTIDRVEVNQDGIISVREKTSFYRDDVFVSSVFKRWTITPGQSLDDQTDFVKRIALAAWEPQ